MCYFADNFEEIQNTLMSFIETLVEQMNAWATPRLNLNLIGVEEEEEMVFMKKVKFFTVELKEIHDIAEDAESLTQELNLTTKRRRSPPPPRPDRELEQVKSPHIVLIQQGIQILEENFQIHGGGLLQILKRVETVLSLTRRAASTLVILKARTAGGRARGAEEDGFNLSMDLIQYSYSDSAILEMEIESARRRMEEWSEISSSTKNARADTKQVLLNLAAENPAVPTQLRNWVFYLEAEIFNLVRHLLMMEPGAPLQQWRVKLQEMLEQNSDDLMVPIVVRMIVSLLLEKQPEDAADATEGGGGDVHQMVDSIHQMVLHLGFVLKASAIPRTMIIPGFKNMCELVLEQSEQELEKIISNPIMF